MDESATLAQPSATTASPRQQPVKLQGASGELLAIASEPVGKEINACIIMLNSGMVNRAGPQRLYWAFTRQAVASGIAVLRVDLAGIGDSLAETNETHFDNHRKADVEAVIEYAIQRWPGVPLVLQGLCAGSRVAFKAAYQNPKIAAILAWSTEIYTASQNMPQSPAEPDDRISEYVVSDTLSRAANFVRSFKFLKPSWWRKHYPGGRGLWTEISYTCKCMLKATLPKPKEKLNAFLSSTDGYLAEGGKVYFLYGEHDWRALGEFKKRFPQVSEADQLGQCYRVIPTGTHTFSTRQSQLELFDASIAWLALQLSSKQSD